MPCTTILVGRKASYDGSTMIARNDDSGAGAFTPKKFAVVLPKDQPKVYKSVLSHVQIELPDQPMKYTAVPNALKGEGTWAACGVNEENVAMTATETITSNPRVLGADPLVVYTPRKGNQPAKAGGIGEEDIVVLTIPYIHSAREGVTRLGSLLETYGTYEENGIAFQDVDEIWWLETIGGHHWMAKRVPDDQYVAMPNQLGIDSFDWDDAYGAQKNHMCSADLKEFVQKNHLDLSLNGKFDPRAAFGSHDDADHVYNTPRAWYMERYFNPNTYKWEGEQRDFGPESDNIPWSLKPEKKITLEDVKYILSSHYQGTPYDPYGSYGETENRGAYRSIGINRTDFMGLVQIRPYVSKQYQVVEWLAFCSNAFNTMVPMYTGVNKVPAYLGNTGYDVNTDNWYWNSKLIGALADASFGQSQNAVERYQEAFLSKAHELVAKHDEQLNQAEKDEIIAVKEKANEETARELQKQTAALLRKILLIRTNQMKNSYARSDH